jgi:sterol desaturase/sphingolipid hydroxylase (fatty acid hydroxylase superfamily)
MKRGMELNGSNSENNSNMGSKIQSKGTRQLFGNESMERLSRTPIEVPISIFIFYGALLLAASVQYTSLGLWTTVMIFLIGFLSFTWVEYMVHRYVFHMSTNTPVKKRLQYILHGVHHEYPNDKERLAMPPVLSISIATTLLYIFWLLISDFAFCFMAGFVNGYALYLFVHYIVHAYAPPSNKFRRIWINHSIHHYKNGNAAFGVTSPLWDYIYKTRISKKQEH